MFHVGVGLSLVREMGLEPTRPKTQEPKSCAATITPLALVPDKA